MFPGTISGEDREKDAFQSYWVNFPCTIPFSQNKLSIDLTPGASITRNYGVEKTTAWNAAYAKFQQTYFTKFSAVIGGLQAAKFIQLEDYIENCIRVAISDEIPFIGQLEETKQK